LEQMTCKDSSRLRSLPVSPRSLAVANLAETLVPVGTLGLVGRLGLVGLRDLEESGGSAVWVAKAAKVVTLAMG